MGQRLLSAPGVLFFVFFFFPKRQKSLFGYARFQVQNVVSSVAACGIWLPHQESDSGSLDGERRWEPGRWSPGKPF